MESKADKEISSNWWRLAQFILLWFLTNVIAYLILIIPFYPIQLSRELHESKYAEDSVYDLLSYTSIFIGTLITFWYMKQKVEKISIRDLFKSNLMGFYRGSSIGIAIVLIAGLIPLAFNLISITYTSANNIPALILLFALVAITEEVFCRGYLLNNLLEKMPRNVAIIVSSLIFSLMHVWNPHFGLIGFINIFLSGVLMARIYLNTGDLWAPIGLHFTWNLTQAVLGFAVSGRKDLGLFRLDYLSSTDFLTGGKFGIEGSLILTVIVTTLLLLNPKPNKVLKTL